MAHKPSPEVDLDFVDPASMRGRTRNSAVFGFVRCQPYPQADIQIAMTAVSRLM